MDRIESAVVTDNPYSVPFTFDAREYMKDAFGVMREKGGGGRSCLRGGRGLLGGGEDLAPESGDRKAPPEAPAAQAQRGRHAGARGVGDVVRGRGGGDPPPGLREAVRKAGEEIVRRYGRE